MKILLLGEYSGYHTALSEGLRELGHEIVTASSGEGYRKFIADIKIYHGFNYPKWFNFIPDRVYRIFGRIYATIKNIKGMFEFKGYDVVQAINPVGVYGSSLDAYIYPHFIKRHNKKLILLAAGTDCVYLENLINFDWTPYDYLIGKEKNLKKLEFYNTKYRCVDKRVLKYTDLIIPIMYDYDIAYRRSIYKAKVFPYPILAPINTNKIKYKDNIVKDKIIIFHGLNREEEKGTPIIREALNIIKEKYPDKVQVIIDGKMPFNEYVKLMETVNVVIDQCRAYGYGVNAAVAMAMGKVVMASCSDEVKEYLNIPTCPIVNIKPDVDFIVSQLVDIIENMDILDRGKKGRKFVEEYHDYVKIAQKFVQAWS